MNPIPTVSSPRFAFVPSVLLAGLAALSLAVASQAQSSYPTPYAITTIAGAAPGSVDGSASVARFNTPYGVAVDGAGNLYVADTFNGTIRKVSASGSTTTLAGTPGAFGTADGTGGAASFNNPSGVAVDASGNVFVTDTNNNTIRKITPGGVVSTFAGAPGVVGSADGTGGAARFNGPFGIAVDSSGNLYVADTTNFTIRKITPAAVVTTLAGTPGLLGHGDATGAAALFNTPQGVAVDGSGTVYVADTGSQTIRKITPAGVVTTLAGTSGSRSHTDGTGISARFFAPFGITSDSSGTLYVADTGNSIIRKITSAGVVTTLAGTPTLVGNADGGASTAQFNGPYGVAVDASGNVYVADSGNDTLRKVSPGGTVTTLAGVASPGIADGSASTARFRTPQSIAVDGSGTIYVADTSNDTIRKITPGGTVTTLAGSPGASGSTDGTGSAARFNFPYGIALDGAGNVYVADTGNDVVRKITPGGAVTTLAGQVGSPGSVDGTGGAARFNYPFGIAVDGSGNIFVADTVTDTIRAITPAGVVTTLAGSASAPGSSDGTGSAAHFNTPQGLAVDGSGNVFVADTYNHTIRKITPAGAVTTVAGIVASPGNADGVPSLSQFYYPQGVAVDGAGNIFVADSANNTIREVASNGVVVTLAGVSLQYGSVDGTGSAALFNTPTGVAVNGSGNLYIADLLNNTIRLGQPTTSTPPPVVQPPPPNLNPTARLINLSVRSTAGTGSQTLIGGFVIAGTGSKSVLARGDGPTLASFSVSGVLPDPSLTVFDKNSVQIGTNSGWGGSAALSTVFSQVGAFALPPASKDAALLTTLAAGQYTANISSTTGDSGVVLVEVYDADTGTPPTRFINLSARSQAGTGSQTLIAGFVISGTGTEKVLIRGIGPGLSQFGVSGVLVAPQLTLFDSKQNVIATNTGWSLPSTRGPSTVVATIIAPTTAVFSKAGAFSLQPSSADCAFIATLPPGSYSAQIAGANATTGVALVEIYEVQ